MNDLELQALWQEQPRELPSAFSPAELEGRSPSQTALTVTSSEFEEARLAARARVLGNRVGGALTLGVMVLLVSAVLDGAWLGVLAVLGSFGVAAWNGPRLLATWRALSTVRLLRERPASALTSSFSPLLALGTVVLLVVLAAFSVLRRPPPRPGPPLPSPTEEEQWVSLCGEAAQEAHPSEADAEACERALESAFLHPEAIATARAVLERHACDVGLAHLSERMLANDLDAAIAAWAALPLSCQARFHPKRPSEEALAALAKAPREACLTALEGGGDAGALRACESYAFVACLAPTLEMPRPGDHFDFQHDRVLARFFEARARTGAPAWECPGATPRPLELPFASPAWPEALQPVLTAWVNGDEQRAAERLAKADVPKDVRADFIRAFTASREAVAAARAALDENADAPARAEGAVRRALDVDARFLFRGEPTEEQLRALGPLAQSPRARLANDLGGAYYRHGRASADRKDLRAACLDWKRGLAFTHGHLDLLKAVTNVCTPMARRRLEDADGCAEVRSVFDFAVDGDGLAEEARARLEADRCP